MVAVQRRSFTCGQLQSPREFVEHTDAQTPPQRSGSMGLEWGLGIADSRNSPGQPVLQPSAEPVLWELGAGQNACGSRARHTQPPIKLWTPRGWDPVCLVHCCVPSGSVGCLAHSCCPRNTFWMKPELPLPTRTLYSSRSPYRSCRLLAGSSWANQPIFLSLHFHICKMEMMSVIYPRSCRVD